MANLLNVCGEDYEFAWGQGTVSFLTEEPWKTLLAKLDRRSKVNLCFLIKTSLWESMKGVPEPPHCHMDVLAEELIRTGVMVGSVNGVCHHQTQGGVGEILKYYLTTGQSYGKLAKAGFSAGVNHPLVRQAQQNHSPEHLAQLLSAACSCLQAIGVLDGLELLPKEPLDAVQVGLSWEVEK